MPEYPEFAWQEAIVNAVAHRDYTSGASVQVSAFADRVEVSNPGSLPAELTPESLRQPHPSIPRNARICDALFLARYIEKFGTGTLMMIDESAAAGLPPPDFEPRDAEFRTTVWRDWLTDAVLDRLYVSKRQRQAVASLKQHGRISNTEYQNLTGVSERTALRDLDELVRKGILAKVGGVGRGAHYVAPRQTRRKPAKPARPEAGNGSQTAQMVHGRRGPAPPEPPEAPRPKRDSEGDKKGTLRAQPRKGARKGPKGR
jgi:predicted HTH transcriptional regulator